jgi:hypothetical protein
METRPRCNFADGQALRVENRELGTDTEVMLRLLRGMPSRAACLQTADGLKPIASPISLTVTSSRQSG